MEVSRPVPLYQQVYTLIKEKIIACELDGGSKLNEVHLARELNISRGPVREAMRVLEQEGLIIRDDRNQLIVYKPSIEDIEHIYQCRQALESLATELAAKRMTTDRLAVLATIIAKKEELISKQSEGKAIITSFADLSSEFHEAITSSCGNPRLKQQIQQLKSLTYLYRYHNTKGQKRREMILEEHRVICQLLKKKNSEEASRFMKKHLANDLSHLLLLFKEER